MALKSIFGNEIRLPDCIWDKRHEFGRHFKSRKL